MPAICCALVTLLSMLLVQSAPDVAAAPEFDAPTAITALTVTTEPGKTIEKATVLIDHGRIVAVGGDVTIPAGARHIDGSGLFAYAGFIDAFTRTGVVDRKPTAEEERRIEDTFEPMNEEPRVHMEAANRNGIFARRRSEEMVDFQEKSYAALRTSGFTAALVAPPRGILGGRASMLSLGDQPLRRSVVASDVLQTASFVPPGARALTERGRYPSTTFGVIAAFRQVMWDADWLARMSEFAGEDAKLDSRIPRDADLLALQFVREGFMPLAWEAGEFDEIVRVLKLADELKFKPMIIGGRDAGKAIDRLNAAKVPIVVSLKFTAKPSEYKLDESAIKRDADDPMLLGRNWDKRSFFPRAAYDEAKRLRDLEVRNAIILENAGATWCITSLDAKPADTLAALREVIETGLSPDAALRALTTTPAALFGVASDLGTIEPGKRANLAIFSKPFADKDAKVRWTFVDGRQFDGEDGAKKSRDKDKTKKDGKDAASKPADSSPGSAEAAATQEVAPAASAPATTTATAAAPTSKPTDPVRTHEPSWPIETDADRTVTWKTGGSVLIKNALVLTVSGDDLPETDVLVEKGKIAKIGKSLAAPAGVRVLDATGYVLSPGVIDGHSHIALDSVNEFSNSITCEVRCADVVRSDDVNVYQALAGGVTTAHLMHGSANTIGGECVLIKLKYGLTADELIIPDRQRTVKFATGENVFRGGKPIPGECRDCAGNRPRRFPGSRMGVEATMRRALQAGKDYAAARAQDDRDRAAGAKRPPLRRDIRLEALGDIVEGKLWINSHCYRADEILRLLAVAEDFGIRVGNLHHCLEAYRIIPEIVRHGCGTVTFADWWAYKVEAYEAIPFNAGMLMRAGVCSTIKSDSGELMRHLPLEAAKCLKYSGLSPRDALRLCTLNVAHQFALDKRTGSIDAGKDADLVLWDGHPLDTFSKCVLTMVDGEVYFRHRDFDPDKPRKPSVAPRAFAATPPTDTTALLQAAAGVGAHPATPPRAGGDAPIYAIVGATLHPVSGPPINDGRLVIVGDKIAGIGSHAPAPIGATVIDGKGLHVYPGLINAATQLGLREIDSIDVTVDSDDSGSYMSDLATLSALNPFSRMVEVTRAEGITSALIVPGGAAIAGQAGLIHLDGWTMPEMAAEQRLALCVSLPFKRPESIFERAAKPDFEDWDEREPRNDQAYRQLREIEEFFRDAKLYAAARADVDEAKRTPINPRFESMIPYVTAAKPVLLNVDSYKSILEAIQFADALQIKPILVGARDAWKVADLLAARQIPVIYEGVFAMPSGVEGVPMATEQWDAHYRGAAILQNAGVNFCFGVRSSSLAKLVPIHAGFAVAHGLDADAAVRAMTLSAAEILGASEQLGSLDVGKLANVIVTTDHPCQATNIVKYAFIRGKPVSLASEHSRAAEKFANRPTPALPPARTDLKGPPSQSGFGMK